MSEREIRDEYAEWKDEGSGDDPRERFRKSCHIAVLIGYDLIDKLRWYEKETLKLEADEIEARLPHMRTLLERLTAAYDGFADIDP